MSKSTAVKGPAIRRSAKKQQHPHKKWVRVMRVVAFVMLALVLLTIVVQLLYPTDRALPLTRVADIEIGGMTKRDAIDRLFDTYGSAELTVAAGDATIETTTDKAGLLVDFQKAADATARYPWWQRLVPFSILYKSQVINATPEITIDKQVMQQFVKKVQEKCSKPVKEAAVLIKDGGVSLEPGADGATCSEKAIQEGLSNVLFRNGTARAKIMATAVSPTKTTAIAREQLDTAQSAIESGLAVTVGNEKVAVSPETIAGWIRFTDDPASKTYGVAYDDAAIRGYLESRKNTVYIAPVATIISLLDGAETNRAAGQVGRDINYDASIAAIKQTLADKKQKTVVAPLSAIPPSTKYLRSYTQTQRGLQVLLADIVAGKGNYGVVVTELGGSGRSASANGDRKYVTASLYKLFVSYMVFKDLESGGLQWESVIVDGLNVRQCFEEMIVRSANRCSVAYINRYGAGKIVAKMHELGFASVEHNSTWWATPSDIAKYMTMLERGELLQGESRSYLIDLMKRQIWRYGIPTGIRGVTVSDKVGFLEDYIHDSAIVYSPKGVYILTIMTKGGSYAGIADVARRVQSYMQQ
jgi:beta-lactamase class A